MPSLPHYRPFRRARNGRGSGVPGPEGMARALARVQASAVRELFDDARHVDTAQPTRLYLPMPIDGAEQRPGADRCQFQPRLNRAHRACVRIRTVRYADLAAGAVLIGFRASKHDRQPVFAEGAILRVKLYQFRTPERAGESEQDSGRLAALAKTSRFGASCATRAVCVAVARENG